jgi:cell division inhibitor SulA
MASIIKESINHLRLSPVVLDNSQSWFDIKNIASVNQISSIYDTVCRQHQHKKKWILMINPEDEMLENLANIENIDTTKILRVSIKDNMFNLKSIKNILTQGNCSAIILSDTHLKNNEISELSHCARQGKTQCIVLNNAITLH